MRVFLVALVLSSVACGGQNPAAPITPPAPVVIFASVGQLTAHNCTTGDCGVEGIGQNTGTGCATAVGGTTALLDAGSSTITTLAWSIDPTRIVRPNDTFTYEAGRLTNAQLDATKSFRTTYSWRAAQCQ